MLPIRYRMPAVRKDSVMEDPIDEKGYAPLVRLCAAFRETEESWMKESDPDKKANLKKKLDAIAKGIETQVAKLFNMFAKAFDGKEGIIRRHGLGRRVDRSARMVITPNPDLGWDQVGLPATAMLELFGDVVEVWWNEVAVVEVAQTVVFPSDLSWSRPHENLKALAAATEILKRFLTANPEYVVLLNRQPSLHRDSFQAFHPVVLPENAGEVIQLCPLVCKGFGADFNGDEMVVHVPLSEQAQGEARKMLPSQNWFSLAQTGAGNHMAHFDQDFVLGTWWLGKGRSQCRERFEQLLSELPPDLAKDLIPSTGPISKYTGSDLLQQLAGGNRDEAVATVRAWMQHAFAACTEMGVSFGFYELADLAAEVQKTIPEKPLGKDRNGALDKIALDALKRLLENASCGLDTPGLHFAAMAVSGARGAKQVRQLIAARGELNPGSTCFELTDARSMCFFIERPLADGLDEDDAFWAAMNARSSMCDKKLGTGQAGGLTRHLVFALRSHEIVSRDCSLDSASGNRSVLTCREKNGFCAKCYGALPDGKLPLVGFRAGMVAAQSIGERGTQLSMQSFHAGKKEIDIMQVRRVLGLAGSDSKFQFLDPSEADAFVQFFKNSEGETKAYRDLDDRHLLLLWTVLHRAALVSAGTTDGKAKSPKGKKEAKTQPMSVKKAIEMKNPLDLLAYRDPGNLLAAAVTQGLDLSKSSPYAKLLL